MTEHKLMTTQEVADATQYSIDHLRYLVKKGDFPAPLANFKRPFKWLRTDIESFIYKK